MPLKGTIPSLHLMLMIDACHLLTFLDFQVFTVLNSLCFALVFCLRVIARMRTYHMIRSISTEAASSEEYTLLSHTHVYYTFTVYIDSFNLLITYTCILSCAREMGSPVKPLHLVPANETDEKVKSF